MKPLKKASEVARRSLLKDYLHINKNKRAKTNTSTYITLKWLVQYNGNKAITLSFHGFNQ